MKNENVNVSQQYGSQKVISSVPQVVGKNIKEANVKKKIMVPGVIMLKLTAALKNYIS